MTKAGDEQAAEVVREAGHWLGVMLASAINVYDPEVIVLGGGVMAGDLGPLMLEAAQPVLASSVVLPGLTGEPQIVFAHFGGEAGLIGAALAAKSLG